MAAVVVVGGSMLAAEEVVVDAAGPAAVDGAAVYTAAAAAAAAAVAAVPGVGARWNRTCLTRISAVVVLGEGSCLAGCPLADSTSASGRHHRSSVLEDP